MAKQGKVPRFTGKGIIKHNRRELTAVALSSVLLSAGDPAVPQADQILIFSCLQM